MTNQALASATIPVPCMDEWADRMAPTDAQLVEHPLLSWRVHCDPAADEYNLQVRFPNGMTAEYEMNDRAIDSASMAIDDYMEVSKAMREHDAVDSRWMACNVAMPAWKARNRMLAGLCN